MASRFGQCVYLKFVLPTNTAGREVIWCQDKFDGNLVAHEAGMLNLLRVKLDPRGAIAMMGNRYPIENIGLAFLTEELLRRGRGAPDDADLQVSMGRSSSWREDLSADSH